MRQSANNSIKFIIPAKLQIAGAMIYCPEPAQLGAAYERRTKMKAKKLLIIALAALVLCFAVGATIAYFTQESEVVRNVITTGNIDIKLIETGANGGEFKDIDGALPGQTYTKVVTVKNTGNNDAFVRIFAGTRITLAGGGKGDASLVTLDFNTDKWELKDGAYYYKEALKPGQTTEPLFTKAAVSEKMGNDYQDCKIEVLVAAQAVQVAHNGSSAVDAAGWPADAVLS